MTNAFDSFFPEHLYHSYIIEGEADVLVPALREFLEQRGDAHAHSSDVFVSTYDAFTVADSAVVKEWHSSRAIADGKKICILGARFVNHEAQQSLLKILEEPHEGSHFFLVVPQAGVMLDTIRSRTHTIRIHGNASLQDAKNFLRVSVGERLSFVAAMIEKHKDTDGSGGLRHDAIELANALEQCVYEKFQKSAGDSHVQFVLGELANARDYLGTPGCSVKMILEHIALVI
jgi:hypothetical protein